ncbi:hypothetical protein ZYGR_0AS00930 [Zygosaccharomyces rouxii]|uniref:Enoyl reductase (ER) domain-containing protein n=1 Tax=Zygosaccharomyces rouxii TaxID=4956 RepID=A0A1Q3AGJ1_ZYGRO|nr:hypothetical protein ZYGR_0AS00930 [Zygosaccharomyces rouxii]
MIQAKQWVLKTTPVPGEPLNFNNNDSTATFQLTGRELSPEQLQDGEVLVEVILLSNDPAQKFWIASTDKNYAKHIEPGEDIPARGVGKVIASKNKSFEAGDYVSGKLCWNTHIIVPDSPEYGLRKLPATPEDKLWYHLSVLGSTALTAYFIFFHYAGLRERQEDYGKTFLISGAAGAVGTVSVQLALNVFHAGKVIAIAGGPEKVKFVESFDPKRVVGVDYKSPTFKQDLSKAAGGDQNIDYFVDNVGGPILDAGACLLKTHATIIACGSISGYNDREKFVFKSYGTVITRRLTIKGVLVTDHMDKFPEAFRALQSFIDSGKISTKDAVTFKDGTGDKFEEIPNIWNGLFHGTNKGKLITIVRNPQ